MKRVTIYLAGSIKKGDEDAKKTSYWTEEDEAVIHHSFGTVYEVDILNPATYPIKRSDPFGNFGADMFLVQQSDFIFVDARDKKGIGIGAEMVAAKYFEIPVVCLCWYDSYYKKRFVPNVYGEDLHNWTHPFIVGLSDFIADSIPEAVEWMKSARRPVKTIAVLEQAIQHFKETQLSRPND